MTAGMTAEEQAEVLGLLSSVPDVVQLTSSGWTSAQYIQESLAGNTRRAYRADLEHFLRWGGTLPCLPDTMAAYLAAHAEGCAVATLKRRCAAISKAHRFLGHPTPTSSELVRATMQGIKRTFGVAQQQAQPLLLEDLVRAVSVMGATLKDTRDRALLLLGFAGAFRRSELVGLRLDDMQRVKQGYIVHLRRSKTDQEGEGRNVGIPSGRTMWCPVTAIERWLEAGAIEDGALFRSFRPDGSIAAGQLSSDAVATIIKARVRAIGMDPRRFSGHSLRAGLVTSAARAGVSSWKIRAQTGHTSDAMLSRYIRDSDLFSANAAASLL